MLRAKIIQNRLNNKLNKPYKHNHKALLNCEYCGCFIVENVFTVTKNSELIWKLTYLNDPISQHLEPKICCSICYSKKINSVRTVPESTHYQVLPTHQLKKFNPKL